jgi:hypothetical protein
MNGKSSEQMDGISKKESKSINNFFLGFLIYTFAFVIGAPGKFNIIICQFFQIIGFLVLVYGYISIKKTKIENNYLQFVFSIYFFWLVLIIIRGYKLDYISIKNSFIDPSGVLLYLIPLVVFLPQRIIVYKRIFNVIIIMGVFFIFCDILFLKGLLDRYNDLTKEYIGTFTILSIPCGFILFTYKYHIPKKNLIALAAVILSFLFAIYRARRGLSFICLTILFFAFLIYFYNTKSKIAIVYFLVLAIVLGIFKISNTYKINYGGLFGYVLERGEADTRTGVEIFFYNDMKTKDWIFGRGINGEYYCPGIDSDETDYRSYIETGYLQIILKGGLISLVLYLLMAVPALFLGFFNSQNMLARASALWIFIALISLYPTSVDSFSLQYMLVWISIAVCYSKKIRNLTDSDIISLLNDSQK